MRLPRTVLALGAISFFTDVSSEMIYPLLPTFLATALGATAFHLGLIEGVAETTASALKIASGIWTDRIGRRKPFVVGGYGLAGVVRPLIGLAASWKMVFLLRFLDRVGKGIRASPRDALIADATDPERRGRAFGFHRAMDHTGAIIGPLVATALLALPGSSLRKVFLLASVPAAIALLLSVFLVSERPRPAHPPQEKPDTMPRARWRSLPHDFKALVMATALFTLGNSTDAFLLMRLGSTGLSPAWVAALWSAHHGVKVAVSFVGGHFTDRFGPKAPILLGWSIYAIVYLIFGMASSPEILIPTFLAYGIFFGLTEPAERAWIASTVPAEIRGTAFGVFHLTVGVLALPASVIFGLLWQNFGAMIAFSFGALLAACAALLLGTSARRTIPLP